MDSKLKLSFITSQLRLLQEIKDTEKTKLSIVYHEGIGTTCVFRICKNRDLSSVYDVLRRTRNPNIVVIYDYVYDGENTYILEEKINGKSLDEVLEENGTFSEKETANVICSICNALSLLHKEQPPVVHNDINPSNIMVCDDGSIKLFDFDISRSYKVGHGRNTALFGTEEYASPEHFGYGQSEPRTDIYCLGVTMNKMLTGHVLTNEHRATYAGKMSRIINKCLQYDPKNRYSSVTLLKKDLEHYLQRRKRMLRNVLLFSAVILVLTSFAAVSLLFLKHSFTSILPLPNLLSSHESAASKDTTENAETIENEILTLQVPDKDEFGENPVIQSSELEHQTTDREKDHTPTDKDNHSVVEGSTRESAKAIKLGDSYFETLDENDPKRWYRFTTSPNYSSYRLQATSDGCENPITHTCYLALYNSDGIKLDEISIFSYNAGFIDVLLEPSTEYTIKISEVNSGTYPSGNYVFCVLEQICDAGTDKDTAVEITVGRHTAVLNSTLDDWFYFQPNSDGIYNFTLHNIDVGCTIQAGVSERADSVSDFQAKNEDNDQHSFSFKAGETIYIRIKSYCCNPVANGTYAIDIEQKS